jgi:REP element-mobilizing transposase RayT
MRKNRFIPKSETLVEVTCRTVQSRLLLHPRPEVCRLILGVLGRAQRLFQMKICNLACLSNHIHLLLVVDDAEQLSSFMEYVNSNIAREVGRLVDWKEKFWGRRYHAILVSDEPRAQEERYRYILSQGVKEGLVEKVRDWPGVHGARAILDGEPLQGYWFDRTREGAARRRGEEPGELEYATEEKVVLSPPPCWKHWSEERIRARVAEMVEQIEKEAEEDRRSRGVKVLGAKAILAQAPHQKPKQTKRTPAPGFHAVTKAARLALRDAYALFMAAYQEAAEKLRGGDRSVRFPEGSFPPALPFVRGALEQAWRLEAA